MRIFGSTGPTLTGKRIVLGVTGSIAAYKAVSLLRALVREGAIVQVVMTQSATKFVTPLTFEVLSGHPVSTDVFEAHQEMKHLSLPEQVDAIVIAPATGLPISTTHTLVGAVLGVGLARGIDAIDLRVVGRIMISWVVTIPAGAALSIVFYFVLKNVLP